MTVEGENCKEMVGGCTSLSGSSSCNATPRVSRGKAAREEATSTHSTPARTGSRVSLGGGRRIGWRSEGCLGVREKEEAKEVDVPHFELEEDDSFWNDRNVQVLIRIRPLSNSEKISQGNGRCLRQDSPKTLVWQGNPETRLTFDQVACEKISQEKLFRVAGLPMVQNCLLGYNSCIFAYGQTGSGKTYTMMGDICEVEGRHSDDCGITPRIFKYLFTRIRLDEESRKEENLMYRCKCSFLEIYNEQITDLLEPSSVNLQLREDTKNGVFVENLAEYNVRTVKDVIKLLREGAANRKMAATHMNSESSRSHSVFTCTLESHWEKDSMTHLRFARLNLVDLAGSERQKSSGAEGDRLKESVNINRSLSTLGLVIMSLVDLAHGRHRHVPYRDSRLTFLLQDSLGGNSKTMIIANVSPSIGSASETLGTLKFAQRAKLIQNNAKVNEDASGNVSALQRQIEQLKDQLSFLMKSHYPPRREMNTETSSLSGYAEQYGVIGGRTWACNNEVQPVSNITEIKSLGVTLVGSLRRERDLQQVVEKLRDEIENLKLLVREKDEEANRASLILKLHEDSIKRLTLLTDGDLSAEAYLVEQNRALMAENHLLQERINRNSELVQLTLRNTQLAEELPLYRTFYEQGEREHLLAEVSDMRSQLLGLLERNSTVYGESRRQEIKDLEDCQEMNARLMRELDELRTGIQKDMQSYRVSHDSFADSLLKDPEEFWQAETSSLNDSDENTMAICTQGVDESLGNRCGQSYGSDSNMHRESLLEELAESKGLNKAFQSEHLRLIKDFRDIQEENEKLKSLLGEIGDGENSFSGPSSQPLESSPLPATEKVRESIEGENKFIEGWLEKIVQDLQTFLVPNQPCLNEDKTKSVTCLAKSVLEQAETEARTIHWLNELTTLQQELCERLSRLTEKNERLDKTIAAKEEEITVLTADWEKATLELTSFLIDGSRSLKDASRSVQSITFSFPNNNVCISEQLKRAAVAFIKKEEAICLLQESLENARKAVQDMELKLTSLRVVTELLHESCNVSERSSEEADPRKDSISKLERISNKSEEFVPGTMSTGDVLALELEHDEAAEVAWGWEEIKNSVSQIELHFLHVQRNVEEMFHVLHLNVMSMRQDLFSLAGELKSLMEGFSTQIREAPFCLHSRLQHLITQLPSFTFQVGMNLSDEKAYHEVVESLDTICLSELLSPMVIGEGDVRENNQDEAVPKCSKENEVRDVLTNDNSVLRNELERKDFLLQGLLFDLSLLQEAASDRIDVKDNTRALLGSLTKLQDELEDKTRQLKELKSENKKLVDRLANSENALATSLSDRELDKETIDALSLQIDELRALLKDIYLKKSKAEAQLNEQQEATKVLEAEIIHLTSSRERTPLSSEKNIQGDSKMITSERYQLLEEVHSLNNKLDSANLLADEKEAIAAEARQEAEASKLYAEQREAEVKILEHSVEELERTIDALEKKVCEMDHNVERHKLFRDSQELELAALKSRLTEVESLPGSRDLRAVANFEGQISSEVIDLSLELSEALKQIKLLDEERSEQEREIEQCREYISELILHAEAQASQYQQKYKDLEDMAYELKADLPNLASTAPVLAVDKHDTIARRRGSSSPFRCISSLLQQANLEKDQELSATRLRFQELEALTSIQQEEVYVLRSRLAAAESMTHDVIRDLLGVRIDMSKYADLVEQLQMQKLVETAYLQREDFRLMEQEVSRLRKQIQDLAEEKECCIMELNHKEADFLAVQMAFEQLKHRDQLLSAQNEMLKRDKTNLNHKVAELDDMVGKLLGTKTQKTLNQKIKAKENGLSEMGAANISKRLTPSEKLNSYIGDQVLRHQSPRGSCLPDKRPTFTSRPSTR